MAFLKRLILKGKYFLITIIFVFAIPIVFTQFSWGLDILSLCFEKASTGIKLYGLILQIAAIIVVFINFKNKIKIIKGSTFIREFKALFGYEGQANIRISGETIKITEGQVQVVPPKPKEEFPDIIRYIDENIRSIKKTIENKNQLTSDQITEIKKKSDQNFQSTIKEISSLNKKVSSSLNPNIWIEFFEITALIVGIILSTFPDFFIISH